MNCRISEKLINTFKYNGFTLKSIDNISNKWCFDILNICFNNNELFYYKFILNLEIKILY